MIIVVTAHYHNQPPLDTPARVWTRVKAYAGSATLDDAVQWAKEQGERDLVRIEIQPEDVGITPHKTKPRK